MSKFSTKSNDINASGVTGGGHPPVLHNWPIPAGLIVKAGQVLVKPFGGDVDLWDGATDAVSAGDLTATSTAVSTATSTATSTVSQESTTKDVSAVDTTVDTDVDTQVETIISGSAGGGGTGVRYAIAVNDTMDGDTGVTVLVHGCYLFSRALVGTSQLTMEQCDILAAAGLFAENVW